MRTPVALCFSGGKDSVLALQEIRRQDALDVVTLLTTVTDEGDRVSMHGVRRTLLRRQAESLGIPLVEVPVQPASTNVLYEREMGAAFARLRSGGVRHMAFGDIFLDDLRTYRERLLARWNLTCVFPLWHRDTATLASTFVRGGSAATIVCVNPEALHPSFAGRAFDDAFLADLPDGVDPCGENGEFHTFVSDGPMFRQPVAVTPAAVVERDGFIFCDLTPGVATPSATKQGDSP